MDGYVQLLQGDIPMKNPSRMIIIYAVLLLIGGFMGYKTKGSLPSLTAGTICSLLFAITAWGIHNGSSIALRCCRFLLSAMIIFFGYRLWLTGAFMPAGLMLIISSLTSLAIWNAGSKAPSSACQR
jgi:uncharacterized membrane protein (UPF0136 family)